MTTPAKAPEVTAYSGRRISYGAVVDFMLECDGFAVKQPLPWQLELWRHSPSGLE